MTDPQRLTERMTCVACPTQWEGTTTDGRYWYFRFRSGVLSLGFGATDDDAVDDSLSNKMRIGDMYDSSLTDEQYHYWWPVMAQRWTEAQ